MPKGLADILANQDPFEVVEEGKTDEQEVSPAESPAEKTQPEESPSQKGEEGQPDNTSVEEKQPEFHKHPRWQEMLNKNKSLNDIVSRLSPLADQLPKLQEQVEKLSKTPAELPKEFKELFGDNADAWKHWRSMRDSEIKDIEDRIFARFKQEQEQSRKSEAESMDRIASAIQEEVEQQFNVALPRNSSDYNAFLKFANELVVKGRAPMRMDDSGQWVMNFGAAWEQYQTGKEPTKKPVEEARKSIAKKMGSDKSVPTEDGEDKDATMDDFAFFKARKRASSTR